MKNCINDQETYNMNQIEFKVSKTDGYFELGLYDELIRMVKHWDAEERKKSLSSTLLGSAQYTSSSVMRGEASLDDSSGGITGQWGTIGEAAQFLIQDQGSHKILKLVFKHTNQLSEQVDMGVGALGWFTEYTSRHYHNVLESLIVPLEQILENYLLTLNNDSIASIQIMGFSRGAAIAQTVLNRIFTDPNFTQNYIEKIKHKTHRYPIVETLLISPTKLIWRDTEWYPKLNEALYVLTDNKYQLKVYINSVLEVEENQIIIDPVWTLTGGISPLDVRLILGWTISNRYIEYGWGGEVKSFRRFDKRNGNNCSQMAPNFNIIKLNDDVKDSYDISSIAGVRGWVRQKGMKQIHFYSNELYNEYIQQPFPTPRIIKFFNMIRIGGRKKHKKITKKRILKKRQKKKKKQKTLKKK